MERVSVLCLLLLLCSLSGAELQDNEIIGQREVSPESVNVPEPQPCPSDLHAVLREMTAKLAVLQNKMETLNQLPVKMEQLQTLNQEQNAKLSKNEVRIEQLQTLNQEQAAKLKELKTQVEAHQQEQTAKLKELEKQTSQVDMLKLQQQAHTAKLREVDTMKQQLHAQATELTSVKTWANVTENHVTSLTRDRAVGQVAFSASLASGQVFIGPFNAYTPLVFRHVISNLGNAYSPNTGFFIAPVKGAYHFEFYIGTWKDGFHESMVGLVKNGAHVVYGQARSLNGHSNAGNGATLVLEVGDVVFLQLRPHCNIYDNDKHLTSFNGHLLFPM